MQTDRTCLCTSPFSMSWEINLVNATVIATVAVIATVTATALV